MSDGPGAGTSTHPLVAKVVQQLMRIDELNTRHAAVVALRERDELLIEAQAPVSGELNELTALIKDNIDVAGLPCCGGSRLFLNRVPLEDAPAVGALRTAGAIVLGKAGLLELAFSHEAEPDPFGQCRNAWDPTRFPGGSSSGSSVAVALGFCDVALGSDTGGSVRVPAALNGVVGLRPTMGRVSTEGVLPVSKTFDTVGPLARSAADVTRVWAALTEGPSPKSPTCDFAHPRSPLKGVRIGVPQKYYLDLAEDVVREHVLAAAAALQALGATLSEMVVPSIEKVPAAMWAILFPEFAVAYIDEMRVSSERITPDVAGRVVRGASVTAAEYLQAQEWRSTWTAMVNEIFKTVDVVLTPTTPIVAPAYDDVDARRRLSEFTIGWSMAGVPALSMPCGFDARGLPIGVQLAGGRDTEHLLLGIGRVYESVTEWQRSPEGRDGARGGR